MEEEGDAEACVYEGEDRGIGEDGVAYWLPASGLSCAAVCWDVRVVRKREILPRVSPKTELAGAGADAEEEDMAVELEPELEEGG